MSSGNEQQVYDDGAAIESPQLASRRFKVFGMMEMMCQLPHGHADLDYPGMVESLINRMTDFIAEWRVTMIPAVTTVREAPPPGADGEPTEE